MAEITMKSEDAAVIFTSADFNFRDSSGRHFYKRSGLTPEAQNPPDDINMQKHSNTILKAGQPFKRKKPYINLKLYN